MRDTAAPFVDGPGPAHIGPQVLELNEELVGLAGKLSLKNLELEHVRDCLETLVRERTAALERSNSTFRQIQFAMDSVGIGVLWADMDTGRMLYVNDCTARMLGYTVDELLRLSIPDIDPGFDHATFMRTAEALRQDRHMEFESTLRAKDGRPLFVEVTLHYDPGNAAFPAYNIAFIKDVTARRAADLALAKAEGEAVLLDIEKRRVESEARMRSRKLEAVGTLAAGMAHEFNNILGSIVGFAEMTVDALESDTIPRRNVLQILSAGFRARDLIARMLAFARQGPSDPVVVDVVATVRDALAMLRASLRPAAELTLTNHLDEASGPATILADPTQVQQIVMNLCINAAHAMNDRGTIRVQVDPADSVEGAPAALLAGICLTVTDDGVGMTPEVLERMFDPFFTTKAPNEGSGLGLSVVYGVVADLGGVIRAESRVNGSSTGTRFQVFLPIDRTRVGTGDTHGANTAD
jgi:PAS domain S-box-containing protein